MKTFPQSLPLKKRCRFS